ncbi:MAG: hypothetical protein R3F61_36850 [Myxococcota bacterium]
MADFERQTFQFEHPHHVWWRETATALLSLAVGALLVLLALAAIHGEHLRSLPRQPQPLDCAHDRDECFRELPRWLQRLPSRSVVQAEAGNRMLAAAIELHLEAELGLPTHKSQHQRARPMNRQAWDRALPTFVRGKWSPVDLPDGAWVEPLLEDTQLAASHEADAYEQAREAAFQKAFTAIEAARNVEIAVWTHRSEDRTQALGLLGITALAALGLALGALRCWQRSQELAAFEVSVDRHTVTALGRRIALGELDPRAVAAFVAGLTADGHTSTALERLREALEARAAAARSGREPTTEERQALSRLTER